MKNTFKYIIASVALAASALSFSTVALAQSVQYDKKISGPNKNGVYTINLEAYVTGSVTVETEASPADIVLVLDYSTSMYADISGNGDNSFNNGRPKQDQRISLLRSSVKDFVKTVQTNNAALKDSEKDEYGGHRIAFVLFSENVYTNAGLNTFINAENLTTTDPSGSGNSYVSATVTYGSYSLLGSSIRTNQYEPTPSRGTDSDKAMEKALSILNDQDYTTNNKRSRVVVFFTDGAPGGQESSTWYTNTGRIEVADGCIGASYTIKTTDWNDAPTTVYAIGMFSDATSATAASTYLSFTSSDYPKYDSDGNITEEGSEMPKRSNGQGDPSQFVTVSGDKSVIVTTSGALDNVFSSIADISSQTGIAASSSSVMVDIVASNFSIPEDTDLGTVKVYKVACTQASASSIISFSNTMDEITDDVELVTNKENGEVSVTGFDYGENWCGYDETIPGPHGNKLVLEIPITVKDDIVGGPSVDTNDEGSQLIIKDSDGNILASYAFISPVVKIPVTIWIKKEGLLSYSKDGVQGHEDNAVFTLRKTKFIGFIETDEDGEALDGGKRIEYTYAKDADGKVIVNKYIVNGVETELKWTNFTKVSVNMKDHPDGIVKITGLDPDYVYMIAEDAWAHLGYDFDPVATARYTIEWDPTLHDGLGGYKDVQNPFTFTNTPKSKPAYAEDVIRNVFNVGSGEGQGIITTGTSTEE